MIALAISTVACAQIEDTAAPQTPETPADENSIVFTANVPTRTAIADDDKTVTWVAGDQVKFVWDGGETVATAAGSGANTTFTIRVDEPVEEVYAVYPADVCGGFSEGEVTLNFSNQLTGGEFSKADICVAKSVKNNGSWNTTLNFKNAACLLKVGVTTDDITRVQVQSVGEEIISGSLPVSIDADGELVFGEVAGEKKNTVNMEVSGAGNYYVSVLPDVEMASGFRVNCFMGDEALTPFYYNGAFTTERGEIIKLSEIESRLGQYYVTPEGSNTKTGQSWSNAMDVETFKTFVTNQDNHFLLKGATFHFSADDFSFGDDYLILNYPDHSNVAFTLEGTVTPTDTTVFLGRTNTTDDNKAGVLCPQNNTYLTIRNVKFTGTDGKSNSSAIRLNTGAKELTLESCWFRGNKTTGNGGSISLFNSCKLTVRNCSFSDNGFYGSALHVQNESAVVNISGTEFKSNVGNVIFSQDVATLTLTDCVFKNNVSDTGDSGCTLFVSGKGTFTVTNTDFIGNSCNLGTNVNRGGIVYASSDVAVLRFDGCLFEKNDCYRTSQSNEGLGTLVHIYNKSPKYYFNACEFKDNTNGVGGQGSLNGVMIVNRGGTDCVLAMNNCAMYDNYANRNSTNIDWIYWGNNSTTDFTTAQNSTLLIANSTIIGAAQTKGAQKRQYVIDLYCPANYYFLNSIICTNFAGGTKVFNAFPFTSVNYYSKTSGHNDTDGSNQWGADTGSGHDYHADYISGLNSGYIWNGTFTNGTNKDDFAPTSGVNEQIQAADSDFYNWLNEIGALGKDINGNDRGTTSWPGCYQAN